MTQKQLKIIQAALELFSEDGFHATSTYKIAKKAGVSEGLIFRHFKNKEGLIQSIIKELESRIKPTFIPILQEEDSKLIIKKTLEFPFIIKEIDLEYWKLLIKLKWELNINISNLMQPLENILNNAFTQLKYREPKLETELVLYIVESILSSKSEGTIEDEKSLNSFILRKYHF